MSIVIDNSRAITDGEERRNIIVTIIIIMVVYRLNTSLISVAVSFGPAAAITAQDTAL